MKLTRPLIACALPLLLTGCSGGSSTKSDDPAPTCGDLTCDADENMVSCAADCDAAVPSGAAVSLDDCAGDHSQADIDQTLAVVDDLQNSYHEMVACGSLLYTLLRGLIDIFESAITGIETGTPAGFEHGDDGAYTASSSDYGDVTMVVEFYFGNDYEAGAASDRVEPDLFDLESYLTDIQLELDLTNEELILGYGEVGPLVELLGFGSEPENPLVLTIDDAADLGRGLRQLELSTLINVEDPRASSVVTYGVYSPIAQVSAVLADARLDLDHLDAAADSNTLDQHVASASWDVVYLESPSNALDGAILMNAEGGAFDYDATFTFASSPWPDISLACPAERR